MTIWSIRIGCWIPKATNASSEYIKLIAFPLQIWISEFASLLCYMYIACLVINLSCLPEQGSVTNRNMLQNKSSCCMQLVCTVLWWLGVWMVFENCSDCINQFETIQTCVRFISRPNLPRLSPSKPITQHSQRTRNLLPTKNAISESAIIFEDVLLSIILER